MENIEFVNKSDYEFIDISSEKWREYNFGDHKILLKEPVKLALTVSQSGHIVFTNDGLSHYIPSGWIHLRWAAKVGAPNFVK